MGEAGVDTAAEVPLLVRQIPLKHLFESPLNPRHTFEGMEELQGSIKEHGVLVPLLVRDAGNGTFEILAGARRFRAAAELKFEDVPCRVLDTGERESGSIEVILVENLQRENVPPMEEAELFHELLLKFNGSVDELSRRLSKPKAFLRQRIQLLKLIPAVRKAYEARKVNLSGAMEIARLTDKDQKAVVEWLKNDITPANLSESIRDQFMLDLKDVPWKLDDADLVKKAGACLTCPKRTGTEKDLFADMAKDGDRCTDSACFREKALAYLERRKAELEKGGEKPVFGYSDHTNKPTKGALLFHEWRPTKKGACKATKPILLLEFAKLGKLVYGCTAPGGCKECGAGTKESTGAVSAGTLKFKEHQKKEREKSKRMKTVRGLTLKAVLEKDKSSETMILRRLAIASFHRLWDLARVDLCRFLAEHVKPEFQVERDKFKCNDYTKAEQELRVCDTDVLHEVATSICFAADLGNNAYGDDLFKYAKEVGVNVEAIEKEVSEVEKAGKDRKASKKGKKPKEPGGGKAGVRGKGGKAKKVKAKK